jgi:homoserine kinase type II
VSPDGSFVAKRAWRAADVELYALAAEVLNRRGVRQPTLRPTRSRALVGSSGVFLLEYLHGAPVLRPSGLQTKAVMGHLARYHLVLAEASIAWTPEPENFSNRVCEVDFILSALATLPTPASGPDASALRKALGHLRDRAAQIRSLPRHIVHGDLSPDNVLMSGDDVVAVIDFTPHRQPLPFALASALYWYHLYDRPSLELSALVESVAAFGQLRPWSTSELELLPAMVVREALRRLVTALAAPGSPTPTPGMTERRWHALGLLVDRFDELQDALRRPGPGVGGTAVAPAQP